MKLTPTKKDGTVFVADLAQLKALLQRLGKKQNLVLAGELFLCSLEPLASQPGFLPQPARRAAAGRFTSRAGGPELKMALDREALPEVQRLKARPVFAVDCLLRYGLKLPAREEHVVIAAFETSMRTSVMALIFRKGVLAEFLEFEASHPSAHTHEADLHAMMERLRLAHPSAGVHWCGPLAAPAGVESRPVPESLWLLGPAQVLTTSVSATFLGRHGLPGALVLLAGAAYAGALFWPYEQFRASASRIESESRELKGQYAFASDRLAMLGARESFFKKQAGQGAQLQRLDSVLAVLAQVPGHIVVKDAQVQVSKPVAPEGAQAPTVHDFELTLEVERDADQNAIAQSEPILRRLSEGLGADVRLSPQGGLKDLAPANAEEKGVRVYHLQGDFRRAS